jgi:hypothetical protein
MLLLLRGSQTLRMMQGMLLKYSMALSLLTLESIVQVNSRLEILGWGASHGSSNPLSHHPDVL